MFLTYAIPGPSSRRFLAYFYWNPTISRNFERFVFQLLNKNLLKSISAIWGVHGTRKFFWGKWFIRSLSTFFSLSVIFLFAKWQLREVFRITCRREVYHTCVELSFSKWLTFFDILETDRNFCLRQHENLVENRKIRRALKSSIGGPYPKFLTNRWF